MTKLLLLLLILQDSPLETAAKAVADQIREKPGDLKVLFHETMLAQVPETQLVGLFAKFHGDHGPVTGIRLDSAENRRFVFTFEKGVQMPVTITLSNGKIIGLWFGPPQPVADSISDIVGRLKGLPGSVSFQLFDIDAGRALHELNAAESLAIGSTFKLYILAALVEDKKPWDGIVKLRKEWRSLPSGELQKWPEGSPLTVHSLASMMISKSDNTATDHLLHHAGRERVEAMLAATGHAGDPRNLPFLTTGELFRIKYDKEVRKAWLASKDRRGMLRTLRSPEGLEPILEPTEIDTLEWFASAADLCRLMAWFHAKKDPTALEIMAINPGLPVADRFTYVGFKGGSEPGVLNGTWLLRTKKKAWALSASWNDASKEVDQSRFFGLLQSILDLLGKEK